MRIISGQSRGRKLLAPEGLDTRPTTDRVKESMFNLIIPFLPAKNVLDLFAGSGALGIEALSRHSEHCVFVENDKSALSVIKKNIELSRQGEKSEVISSDAFTYLGRAHTTFDIIFLDPPYNKQLLTKAVEEIHRLDLLAKDGIIVAESEVGGETPPDGYFDILKQAKYGKTMVFVLGRKDTQGGNSDADSSLSRQL